MAQRYDITTSYLEAAGYRPLVAGDDWDHEFEYERPEGSVVDITNFKIWFTIKKRYEDVDDDAALQYDSDDPTEIEKTDAVNGKFEVHLKSADTPNLAGSWSYDLQVKDDSDKITTIAYGTIEFIPQITIATT